VVLSDAVTSRYMIRIRSLEAIPDGGLRGAPWLAAMSSTARA
jgi:hypothetical protein